MKVELIESSTGKVHLADIKLIKYKELPLKKDGWSFNWKSLFKIEGSELYKISLEESPSEIQGVLMVTILYGEMLFMNNVENAPHNIGKNKRYENTAGCLLAFACKLSFEKGKGNYVGFLSFDSKTKLVELYQNKYGASLAMGHKMFFGSEAGKALMKKYLKIKS